MAEREIGQPSVPLPAPPGEGAAEEHFRRLVQADPANAEAWFQLGLIALRRGRHPEAIDSLEKAAARDPEQALVHHHLATCYQALGQRDRAVQHFHRVVCLKPEFAAAHNNWGIGLAQQGRPAEAAAAFAQAVRLQPDYPEAHNNWGNALFEQGQFEEAVRHFRQALAQHPQYAEAHNNLGLALLRLGRADEALAAFQEAVRLQPTYAGAQQNLGNLQRDRGRLDEAVRCYRQALQARPEHREVRLHLALTLARQGMLEEAIAALHQSLLFHPDDPDVYNHLGILLSQRDRLDEAGAAFRQALRLRPQSAEVLNNLGNTLLRQQKSDDALRCFSQALQWSKDYPQPHCNMGSALLQQGKAAEAVAHYLEAIRLQPDYVDAHFNLGNAYRNIGRPEEALGCYQRVLDIQPGNLGARLNLGVALSEQGRLDEASRILEELLRDKPDFAEGYNSLGVTRLHQGRPDEALAAFEEGLRHKPDDPDTHLNRALAWLAAGDYERGWTEYEWRWKRKQAMPGPYPQPAWDGSRLPQGTIILWAEQGLGDTLQFVRYAPLVKARVGTVLVDCPAPLRGLVASCPGVDGLAGAGVPTATPDVQAPLLSLPRILGTTVETVPASVPYLFVDAPLRERWREKVGPGRGLKVGISWQGNPQFGGDRYRSVKLTQFRPLAEVPGVRLFSLQKGKGGEQLAELAAGWGVTDLGTAITADLRDTAAAILNLDLVITVDTAVAHLAGALGVPVWILLPFAADWRWLRGREDSVWYPSARLFRQRRWGDWDEVFGRLAGALRERARRPSVQRVPVPLGLVELVERAVVEEVRQGQAGDAWAAVREAGILDTAKWVELTARLKVAHGALEQVASEVRVLGLTPELDRHAVELMRRYARAQQDRRECLAHLSAVAG